MSEQGWRDFLAADGVGDWVVLHGGATAVFRVSSLLHAARLADAVAQVPGVEGGGVLITVADEQLTVRLTRGVWRLEPRHVEIARAVSAVARRHGAAADRAHTQEVQLAVAAHPQSVDVGFWRAVLGCAELDDDNAIDPLGHGSTVWIAGARRGQAVAACDARRRVRRPRARRGPTDGCARCGRPGRRRLERRRALDAGRPRRQSRVHLRVAGRRHRPRPLTAESSRSSPG
jgi:hypothetical protein